MAYSDDRRLMDAILLVVFGILVLGLNTGATLAIWTSDMIHKVWLVSFSFYIIGLTTLTGGGVVVHQIWRRRRSGT